MIIKRFNGVTFDELYPKTTASKIFAGTTAVFDGNNKIKPAFLPDAVFDGLYFVSTIGANTTLLDIVDGAGGAYTLATTSAIKPTLQGMYFVASANITLTANALAEEGSSTKLWRTKFQPADGAASSTTTDTLETGDWIVITNVTGDGSGEDPFDVTFAVVNNTYELATSTVVGISKIFSDTVQDTAGNNVSDTTGRTYGIQKNSSGQLVVNVPWEDTNTEYAKATNTVLGLIKTGYSQENTQALTSLPAEGSKESSRQYGVQVSTDGNASVYVPWANTEYGLATTSANGLVRLGVDAAAATVETATTTANRFYHIGATTAGNMYVNVPWVNTEYSKATTTTLGLVETAFADLVSNPTLTETTTTGRYYGVQLNQEQQMVVNVPWANTEYTAGEGIALSGTQFSVSGGEGITQETSGVRMTYPLYAQTATPTTSVTGAIWLDIN
jgi:hypothetical protein